MTKRIAFAAMLAAATVAGAATQRIVPSEGPIVPGEWNKNFEAGIAYAREHNVPMVVVVTADLDNSCGNCERLQTACHKPQFLRWASRREPVMIFSKRYFSKAAGKFATPTEKKWKHGTPLCAVYWPKADGTEAKLAFSGVIGKMPAGATKGEPLASQFTRALDLVAGKYVGNPSNGRMLALLCE